MNTSIWQENLTEYSTRKTCRIRNNIKMNLNIIGDSALGPMEGSCEHAVIKQRFPQYTGNFFEKMRNSYSLRRDCFAQFISTSEIWGSDFLEAMRMKSGALIVLAASQRGRMINTICCIYSELSPDDELLIYSKHAEGDICNKLREKSASC